MLAVYSTVDFTREMVKHKGNISSFSHQPTVQRWKARLGTEGRKREEQFPADRKNWPVNVNQVMCVSTTARAATTLTRERFSDDMRAGLCLIGID